MASSFTRILAKKLCRVVICSPPTGLAGNEIGKPSADDPQVGLDHDHRYAGRPVSPLLKRFKSEVCTGKASCVCLYCIQPTLQNSPGSSPSPQPIQVVSHKAESRVSAESPLGSEEMAAASPRSASSPSSASSAQTDYRLTNAFTCRMCGFKAEKLRSYMEHVELAHQFVGLVKFKCHFCPEKFPSYNELVEHSKRYMQQIGAGFTPLPDASPNPDNQEIAKITLF